MRKSLLLAGLHHKTAVDVVELLKSAYPALKLVAIGREEEWSVPAARLVDMYQCVPDPRTAVYVPMFLDICQLHNVGAVLPLSDSDRFVVARARKALEGWGLKVWGPPVWATEALNDRAQLMSFLRVNGVAAPHTIEAENFADEFGYPLRVCDQEHLRGSHLVSGPRQLDLAVQDYRLPLLQEHIEGEEYAVDAVLGKTGKLLGAVAVLCMESADGVLTRAVTVAAPELISRTQNIVRLLELRGPVHLRFKRDKRDSHAIEIRPGFSELLPLAGEAGVNLPALLYQDYIGETQKNVPAEVGVCMRRYWTQTFTRNAA